MPTIKTKQTSKSTTPSAANTITVRVHVVIGPNKEYAVLGYSEDRTNKHADKEEVRSNLKDWYADFSANDIFEVEMELPITINDGPRYKFSVT